ncbi:MAG: WYL domain-containing protein [Clostridia bacterium]|nr:WYL domain-containing protein [Clostridia bacterium]
MQTEETPLSDAATEALNASDFAAYTEQAFTMFGGPEKEVVLQFEAFLINPVLDQFGESIVIKRKNGMLNATVSVQESPTFFGWLAQFPGKMKILSPEEMVRKYRDHLAAASDSGT